MFVLLSRLSLVHHWSGHCPEINTVRHLSRLPTYIFTSYPHNAPSNFTPPDYMRQLIKGKYLLFSNVAYSL